MTVPDPVRESASAVQGSSANAGHIDEEAVVAFLAREPDFLVRRGDVLADLSLPVDTGDSISLLERQVIALREQNSGLREQLATLLANANANDRVFSRTTTFTLALIDAPDLAGLDQVLARCLIDGFDADHARCFVEGWAAPAPLDHLAGVAAGEPPPLAQLFDHTLPICAAHRPQEYEALFPGTSPDGVGSIAIVPLRADALNAALAIGSRDPHRFSPDMGKVFLLYIGDVLSRTLVRLGVR